MLSFFTPTHNTTHIGDVYRSLRCQSVQDWEWVILLSREGLTLPTQILQDSRVRVIDRGRQAETRIGALKLAAAMECRGDLLVEMDHDDMLVPGVAAARMQAAHRQGGQFVYGDVIPFRGKSLKPVTFGANHGWENYPVKIYGRTLFASRTFKVSPSSLSAIYYCPDHVRAWDSKTYRDVGGHNPELPVCDDHELMCRTYLHGAKFRHTGGADYLYRFHEGNTVKQTHDDIIRLTRELRQEHMPGMVREWCRRGRHKTVSVKKLYEEGWRWERDLYDGFGVDEVGLITVRDVLGFCPPHLVADFMNLAYKALVPGGYLEIDVPDAASPGGFLHHTYKSYHSRASFMPYCRSGMRQHRPDIQCSYQQLDAYEHHPSDFHERNGLRYVRVHLAALKGQRQPGLQTS